MKQYIFLHTKRLFEPSLRQSGLKFVHFNSFQLNVTDKSNVISSTYENLNMKRIEVLASALRCTPLRVMQLMDSNRKLLKTDLVQLEQVCTFFGSRFKIQAIAEFPQLLTGKPGSVEKRYEILSEIGIQEVTTFYLIRFKRILGRTANDLKKFNMIAENFDPVLSMLAILNWPEGTKSRILGQLLKKNYQDVSMTKIRGAILTAFLCDKFQCSIEETLQKLDQYDSIRSQPFKNIKSIMFILSEELGLTSEAIKQHAFILKHQPHQIKGVLGLPTIGSMLTKELAKKYPRILTSKPDSILGVQKLLTDYKATDEQLRGNHSIFTLSPNTVQKRLELITKTDNLVATKLFSRHLKLVIHQSKMKKRLELLDQQGNKVSLHLLTSSMPRFSQAISRNNLRTSIRDSIRYISCTLNKSEEQVKKQISVHNYSPQINLSNVIRVINELQKLQISKDQIWNSLPIVLYNVNRVLQVFREMQSFPELQPFANWLSHDLVLELVMYYIEKGTYFSGAGVLQECASKGDEEYYMTTQIV